MLRVSNGTALRVHFMLLCVVRTRITCAVERLARTPLRRVVLPLPRAGASVRKRVHVVWFVSRTGAGRHPTGTLSSGFPIRAASVVLSGRLPHFLRVGVGWCVESATKDHPRRLQGSIVCCAYQMGLMTSRAALLVFQCCSLPCAWCAYSVHVTCVVK